MAGQSQMQLPAAPPKTPGLPENFQILSFSGFEGLNTKPTRPAIGDQQMFICDNMMPLGQSNLRALSDLGSSIYGVPSGLTIERFAFTNISSANIGIVFLSDGSIAQINTVSGVSSAIAGANTIANPSATLGVAQWGSQFVLITAPQGNGYFIWDGTILYQKGSIGPFVNITNSGAGYKTPPAVTLSGGSGTGAAVTATITSGGFVTLCTVTNAGSGYGVTDVVVCNFSGGGNGGTTARATAVLNSAGGVASITVNQAGQGYNINSVQVTILGGGGVGATATVTAVNSATGIQTVAVSASSQGQGYTSVPTVIFTDANNPVAQATIPLMPSGVQGTGIETFTGRVWIVNGDAPTTPPPLNVNTFSAPGIPTDFATGDGAGLFTATDSFVRVGYHGIKQANGFLYLIGDSSVNYISSVQTAGVPAITTFSNQNVDPQIGSPWPSSIQVFSRQVVFANTFGVFALIGGAARKVSSELDGIYTSIAATGQPTPTVGGISPSSAVAVVYGIHIYCLLLPILDQVSGLQVNKILCWDGKNWFTYQPSKTITYIGTQEINSVLTAYGTDGSFIYPLFTTPSGSTTKVVQSKLWQNPTFFYQKRTTRFWALADSASNQVITLNYSIDNELGSQNGQVSGLNQMTWQNAAGQTVPWTTASGAGATWIVPGISFFANSADWSGQLMGMTIKSTTSDFTLIQAALGVQQYKPQL